VWIIFKLDNHGVLLSLTFQLRSFKSYSGKPGSPKVNFWELFERDFLQDRRACCYLTNSIRSLKGDSKAVVVNCYYYVNQHELCDSCEYITHYGENSICSVVCYDGFFKPVFINGHWPIRCNVLQNLPFMISVMSALSITLQMITCSVIWKIITIDI